MQVIEAYQPFEIQEISLGRWEDRPVKNNFFELVLIREGNGTQCINYNHYRYEAGSLFLLPPLSCHSFEIESPTKFVFLKFTSAFFTREQDNNSWFTEASYILSNYNQQPGDIVHDQVDRQHIHALFDLISKENRNRRGGSTALIKSFMTAVLEILVRNIKANSYSELSGNTDSRILQILSYINEHITEPQKLKVEALAKTFHLSPTYLGEYFRKNVKLSLRDYLIKARLKLVEIRLLNSDHTLTEIATELNYTDVSHLSKTFRKYTGMSAKEFRAEGEYKILKRSVC